MSTRMAFVKVASLSLLFVFGLTPAATAILNTSIDLEEHVISVFSYGDVSTAPDGVQMFFRCASQPVPTTREALADCQAKVDAAQAVLKSMEVAVDRIETTPTQFFMKRESGHTSLRGLSSVQAGSDGQPPSKIQCVAVQDLRLTLVNHAKAFDELFRRLVVIEDKMLATELIPIEPNEFGKKGFAFLEQWFGEKKNVEWLISDEAGAQRQAMGVALARARATADDIAKNLNKTIREVHSIQYVDDKDKLRHLWNSFCPISVKGTVELPSEIRYQLGLIVNFTFE